MKIVEINTVDIGSTGRIMLQIAHAARQNRDKVWTFSMARKKPSEPPEGHQYYLSYPEYVVHNVLGKLTGGNGLFSIGATLRLLRAIRKIDPDVIHLHNLHGFCINLPLLFRYIKHNHIPVVWTLHDCWTFTGKCPHFTMVKCDKWKMGCAHCPQLKGYPKALLDVSRMMWRLKKKWFTGVANMTIVTPSQWLCDLVKQSYLKDYSVMVINNGIDLNVFKPTPSDFREKYGIDKAKYIVLFVAFGWEARKGMDVVIDLEGRLPENYQIVAVGTDDKVDKELPPSILSIHRTQNQRELAEIYTAADIFANPTREEVLGLVNIEALACGTPVLTFRTGGSPETIDETCGMVVPCDDVQALEDAIRCVCEKMPFTSEDCREHALQFDMNDKFVEYVQLYQEIRATERI